MTEFEDLTNKHIRAICVGRALPLLPDGSINPDGIAGSTRVEASLRALAEMIEVLGRKLDVQEETAKASPTSACAQAGDWMDHVTLCEWE